MNEFTLTPLDTVFFRGSEPFNAGDDTLARSLFPPTPRTLQGLVRTTALRQHGGLDLSQQDEGTRNAIEQLVGTPRRPARPVQGPYLLRGGDGGPTLYLPVPGHWRYLPGEDGAAPAWAPVHLLDDHRQGGLPARSARRFAVASPVDSGVDERRWLSWDEIRAQLWGPWQPDGYLPFRAHPPLYRLEPRSLIQLDPERGRPRDQMLNFSLHVRLAPDVRFWFRTVFSLRGPDLVAWGGERRQGALETCSQALAASIELPDETALEMVRERRFWLCLAQPARFHAGWYPDQLDQYANRGGKPLPAGLLGGLPVVLRAVVVGNLERLGGFDRQTLRPTPLFAYAPAGSAWLLELQGEILDESACVAALKQLHFSCAVGDPDEREMGFGQVLVGRCPPSQCV